MPEASAFEWVCAEIEASTPLSGIEVRGTVRLALKRAGFAARSVEAGALAMVVERILPDELLRRGVDEAEGLCEDIAKRLGGRFGS